MVNLNATLIKSEPVSPAKKKIRKIRAQLPNRLTRRKASVAASRHNKKSVCNFRPFVKTVVVPFSLFRTRGRNKTENAFCCTNQKTHPAKGTSPRAPTQVQPFLLSFLLLPLPLIPFDLNYPQNCRNKKFSRLF